MDGSSWGPSISQGAPLSQVRRSNFGSSVCPSSSLEAKLTELRPDEATHADEAATMNDDVLSSSWSRDHPPDCQCRCCKIASALLLSPSSSSPSPRWTRRVADKLFSSSPSPPRHKQRKVDSPPTQPPPAARAASPETPTPSHRQRRRTLGERVYLADVVSELEGIDEESVPTSAADGYMSSEVVQDSQPSSSSSAENQNSAQSPGSVHRDGNSLLGPALATTIESDAQRQPSPVRPARAVSPVRPVSEILARQDVPGRVYTHTQLLEFITKLDNERIQQ